MKHLLERIQNFISAHPKLRLALYFARGLAAYAYFIAVLHLTQRSFLLWGVSYGSLYEEIMVTGVRIAVVPALFYSVCRVFALSDRFGYDRTAAIDEQGYAVRWRDIIGSPVFAIQALAVLVTYAVLPFAWGFGELLSTLPVVLPPDDPLCRAVFAPVLLLLIALMALAHRSARHEWQRIRYRRADSRRRTRPKGGIIAFFQQEVGLGALLSRMLGLIILYPLGAVIAAAMLVLVVPVLFLVEFWYIALGLAALLFVPDTLRAIFKRRRLLRGIRRVCEARHYELSRIRTPYLSLLRVRSGADFSVKMGEVTYDCKLLTNYSLPLMRFDYEGTVELTMPLKLRGRFSRFAIPRQHDVGISLVKRKITYEFESDNPKVLVLCPVPAHTLIISPTGGSELDTGAHIGAYRLFNTTGFLGALERNCLDR